MRDPDASGEASGTSPAHPSRQDQDVAIGRLKRRADFLRAAKGRRWHGKAFSLQAGPVEDSEAQGESQIARVGFTVTKKVGGSVVRNRARRRLREALRLSDGLPVRSGHDYVVIARLEAIRLPFSTLQTDLTRAIRSVHAEARPHDASKRLNQALPPGGSKRTRPGR
ncbi:ribonuclease P protein component [Beijerinckia sp. L45]|uniref:ribonuclease P protein component n=1 Tax=Beijerinckia sp. L45 TaxID=1641855 RepID=UPI00131A69C5|nr:ribonuclease P protein component [Beijerinckia sp. L45]